MSLYGITDIGSPDAHQAYREIEQLGHRGALLARLARKREEAAEEAKAERLAQEQMFRVKTMRPCSSIRKEIIAQVCDISGLTLKELTGPSRFAKIVRPRMELMRRLRQEAGMSLPEIGKLLNRDHTTVLHALRKTQRRPDMTAFKIITADQRMASPRGVKALLVGPAGIGKTSQLRTLDPKTTLFVDLEAGDLSVQDLKVDTMRPKTWDECRDLAVFLGGPNPSLPKEAAFSQAHFDRVCEEVGGTGMLDKYETYFIDSITVAGRLCFKWATQQPESLSEKTGKPDIRGAYGLHAREMIAWLTQLQHVRSKNVIFVGILEYVKDEFNVGTWQPQIEGAKTGRELPGIIDQVITMQFVTFDDAPEPVRSFICAQPNPNNYPAKDRSGRLDLFEKPDLGELIAKITAPQTRLVSVA